jgi:transient receptor potential cation channel subfamily A protein 1
MYEKQPELFLEVMHAQDTMHMTPLHKAVMFDYVEIIEYLLEKGAYIDALDKEKRSPLLLAASRNCINSVCYLLTKEASIKLKDSKLRNLLHLLIDMESSSSSLMTHHLTSSSSSNQDDPKYNKQKQSSIYKTISIDSLERIVRNLIKMNNYIDLLNERDIEGCTPMHYAIRLGFANCLKLFISYGSNISIKNKEKQSGLHFAARYGRYASCLQLLSSPNYKNHINEKDNNGMT